MFSCPDLPLYFSSRGGANKGAIKYLLPRDKIGIYIYIFQGAELSSSARGYSTLLYSTTYPTGRRLVYSNHRNSRMNSSRLLAGAERKAIGRVGYCTPQ